MILPIEHISNCKLIWQNKQSQINDDNILENMSTVDYGYQVRDKVMIRNNAAYKYKTPYKGSYKIIQCWTNVTVKLKMSTTT